MYDFPTLRTVTEALYADARVRLVVLHNSNSNSTSRQQQHRHTAGDDWVFRKSTGGAFPRWWSFSQLEPTKEQHFPAYVVNLLYSVCAEWWNNNGREEGPQRRDERNSPQPSSLSSAAAARIAGTPPLNVSLHKLVRWMDVEAVKAALLLAAHQPNTSSGNDTHNNPAIINSDSFDVDVGGDGGGSVQQLLQERDSFGNTCLLYTSPSPRDRG